MRRPTMADPEQILTELIAFDTQNPTGDELAMCEHLAERLRALGADAVELREVPRDPPGRGAYVFARWGAPKLLINAHVDTVPANNGWTRNPHQALITGERIVGLGSADTKGAIACALAALERAEPRDVAVLFSGDEERGTSCMRAFLDSGLTDGIERAVICEPTGRTAGVHHRGITAFCATKRGLGGHSSKADHMPKPIADLAAAAVELDRIGRSYMELGPADMKGICNNIAALDGGVAFNVVPDAASLTWSIRPYPGFDRPAYDARVAEALELAGDDVTLAIEIDHPPFSSLDREGFETLLKDRVRAIVGLDFWTEAALMSQAGIPAVVLGPGDIAQAHTADEFVDRADLAWATDLLFDLVSP